MNMREGKRHLLIAIENGFLTNTDAFQKLAWLEQLSGKGERAVELLSKAAEQQYGPARALSHYYQGAILNRSKRFDDAIRSLDQAISERPDLTAAREEKGESLWQLGRRDEAIAEWERAVSENDRIVIANSFLAGASLENDAARSSAFESAAAANSPDDPLFHWMVGMRLENLGMTGMAEKQFARAIELNPDFQRARN
jgi:superkiller protein 3